MPGSLKDTDFDLVSTPQDASRPCAMAFGRRYPGQTKSPAAGVRRGGLKCEGCRSGGLGRLDLSDVWRSGNRDPARLHCLRNLADQFNLQQAVIKRRALDLDIIGQVELALERPGRDALIQELALGLVGLAAFDRQHILLCGDRDLVGGKAPPPQRYLVPVLAKPLNVAGRVIVVAARVLRCIDEIEKAVKADR